MPTLKGKAAMEGFFFFTVVVAIAIGIFWVFQFVQVMCLSDDDFPGRYDKILWVAAFIFIAWFAPFAFLYWKSTYLAMRKAESEANQTKE